MPNTPKVARPMAKRRQDNDIFVDSCSPSAAEAAYKQPKTMTDAGNIFRLCTRKRQKCGSFNSAEVWNARKAAKANKRKALENMLAEPKRKARSVPAEPKPARKDAARKDLHVGWMNRAKQQVRPNVLRGFI